MLSFSQLHMCIESYAVACHQLSLLSAWFTAFTVCSAWFSLSANSYRMIPRVTQGYVLKKYNPIIIEGKTIMNIHQTHGDRVSISSYLILTSGKFAADTYS